jgi:MarR family transcriptional regulator, organic hydroperoxide resistance regulator
VATKLERASKAYGKFEDRMVQRVTLGLTSRAHSLDLSLSELNALFEIKDTPSLTVSAIAKHTQLSLAAASQLVERMVKRGLVIRQENPNNRRQKKVRLSKAGEKLIDTLNANYDAATRELLAP